MVKELKISDIINFDNRKFLDEIFSEFENATLITANDNKVVMLDEESDIMYQADYVIDNENEEITFSNLTPSVIKEEVSNFGSYVAKAFDISLKAEQGYSFLLEGIKKVIHSLDGGHKQKLVQEARDKSLKKQTDEGRKHILESLKQFKNENASTIKKLQVKEFYSKLLEKLNKDNVDDAVFTVNERMLFERKRSTKFKMDTKSGGFKVRKIKKKRDRQIKQEKVARRSKPKLNQNLRKARKVAAKLFQSPSFKEKFGKLVKKAKGFFKGREKNFMSACGGKNENLSPVDIEAMKSVNETFRFFASKWPALFILSESELSDFALKLSASLTEDKEESREILTFFKSCVSNDYFDLDKKAYLKEEYGVDNFEELLTEDTETKDPLYTAYDIGQTVVAIQSLLENVGKINDISVFNYLNYAKQKLSEMMRTGNVDETLFERIVTDIFGAPKATVLDEEYDEDIDSSKIDESDLTEDEIQQISKETTVSRLISELKTQQDKIKDIKKKSKLMESIDLLKAMVSVGSFDEERISEIANEFLNTTNQVNEDGYYYDVNVKGSPSSSKAVDIAKDVWCPECFTKADKITVKTAMDIGQSAVSCKSCDFTVVLDNIDATLNQKAKAAYK